MIRAEVEMHVPFFDIDILGIAWHGHYCKYIEIARCAMLDKIDYGYMVMRATGYVWPIVDIQLRYVRPARFEQRIKVAAELVEWEYRMKIKYLITDAETGEVLAKGHTVQAAVDSASGEMSYASPAIFLEKLGIKTGAP
ncbi:acyl-CoA thioesterase [Methylomonas sp. SURF-2]|uniref:Acyl-CoA thioesterase n=1 Tax=Methylomonas subterranea TaxID=2952225 RepID=A0ABT1TIX1_9GAMM|nr:acyl-CoA thioesterase [Methylomonas sp. SURF-2]MCQ8105417.1 acyl-CoA thioesterase [Methylomonas sp. SURF-2]